MRVHQPALALFSALLITVLSACSGGKGAGVMPQAQSHHIGAQSFSTTNVPKHLLSAIYGTGYAGVIGPAIVSGVPVPGATYSQQAPYLNWAYTDYEYVSNYQTNGVKTISYASFWITYSDDASAYNDINTGGTNAGAAGTNCSNAIINEGSSGNPGILDDPHKSPYAVNHANFTISSPNNYLYDAIFSDNTAVFPTAPCDYTNYGDWVNNTNTVDGSLVVKNSSGATKPAQLWLNVMGEFPTGGTPQLATQLAAPSNVLGIECEECYINNSSSPYKTGGTSWQNKEDAEIDTVQEKKIFWDYARNCSSASSSYDLRLYEIASFLLTYDPSYTMLQECFVPGSSDFAVMPESQLVPEAPTATASNVTTYEPTSGVALYARQFQECYYGGTLVGSCAVVVNADSTSHSIPSSLTSAYPYQLVLCGGGVLDSGTVSYDGSGTCSNGATPSSNGKAPTSLASLTGVVLINNQPYTADVLSSNPTRFYKLNDASGSIATDYSNNKANGTYLSNVTYGLTGPILTGPSKAISVPGSSSGTAVSQGVSANVPSGGFAPSGASWTAEIWVKPTLLSSSNSYDSYYALWGQDTYHRLLMSSTTGQLLFQMNYSSSGCSATNCNLFSTAKLSSGQWHYVVATYNASTKTAQLYVDGTADASETFSVTTNPQLTGSAMYVGQYDTSAYYKWNGSLADWAFYPSAISSTTVSQHYADAGY